MDVVKKITSITVLHTSVGDKVLHKHAIISKTGDVTRRNITGSFTVTKAMTRAATAIAALERYLADKVPQGDTAGAMKSFSIFRAAEGETVTITYDEIDTTTGATISRNNQKALVLVEGAADNEIAAVNALRDFLAERL